MAPHQAPTTRDDERIDAPWWKNMNMNGNNRLKEMGGVMDCVVQGLEHSMDLLNCDVDAEYKADSKAIPTVVKPDLEKLLNQDFVQLHDDFLLSLLEDQKKHQKVAETVEIPISSSTSSLSSAQPIPSLKQISSNNSFSTENSQATSSINSNSIRSSPSKRLRSVKLPRRSPKKISPHRVSPIPFKTNSAAKTETTTTTPFLNPLDSKSTMRLQTSIQPTTSASSTPSPNNLPLPHTFLHPLCRLQKDKGRGEEPGSDICAYGIEKSMEKLRQKMELLTHIALTEESSTKQKQKHKRGTAVMKRRKAKLTAETQTYTETRSLIDLRKGFLSMQYGVLIRWDTVETGKIILVVLRKMCHDSFYQMEMQSRRRLIRPADTDISAYVVRNKIGGKDVILQRSYSTEVSLLEPPYRVAQPPIFTPSILTINVVRMVGMGRRAKCWTIHVSFQGTYRKTKLVLDPLTQTHNPPSEAVFDWEVPSESIDLSLDVSVFEHHRRRSKKKSLVARKSVPLNLLEARPTNRVSHKRMVTVPVENGNVVLAVLHQSDYAFWLSQELDARRKEFSLTMTTMASPENAATSINAQNQKMLLIQQQQQQFRRVAVVEAPPEPRTGDLWELCCIW